MLKTEGETAQQVISEISPSAGVDISSAIMMSADFESDLVAVHSLSAALAHVRSRSPVNEQEVTEEKYNPLYVPGSVGELDDVLSLDPRTENIRFVGMGGNPFILKTIEVNDGETPIIAAKVEYRPFDIPTYSELVLTRDPVHLN
jgi:hypothetical protein